MSTITQPFAGTWTADPVHSSFGFAVKYMGVSTFRATFDEVEATLTGGDEVALEGRAKVESVSIRTPDQFRQHVLSAEFFDVENTPDVRFRSTAIDLREDGTATVEGELTIKATTRPVTAVGAWTAPAADAFGQTRGHLQLESVVNRHDFGLSWNAPLPSGGNALADEVTITVDLALVAQES